LKPVVVTLIHLSAPAVTTGPVRAENSVRGSEQQSCSGSRLAVMISGHVPAVRVPPDHPVPCQNSREALTRGFTALHNRGCGPRRGAWRVGDRI